MDFFTTEFWSKFIGYVELGINGAGSIFFAYHLYRFSTGGEEFAVQESERVEAVAQYYNLAGYAFLLTILAILLLTAIVGFIMAIVLLKGAYKRDYKRLTHWMIYCIAAVFITFSVLITYGGYVWSIIIRTFVFLTIRGAMIWSVYVDLKELEGEIKVEDKTGITKKDNSTADTAI